MAIFIDTNIIIEVIRDNSKDFKVKRYINPTQEAVYTSYVSVAEVKSFAVQSDWGKSKLDKLELLLKELEVFGIRVFISC
jgi:predicted nucleic acid-binding protein